MTTKRGSWDDTRMAVFTIVPIILLLYGGYMSITRNCDSQLGCYAVYLGIGLLIILVFDITIALFKKKTGCDGCIFNTDERFVRRYEKNNVAK